MSAVKKKILITDTSVLINFLNIDRIDLLASFPGIFLITEHVVDEITTDFPDQRTRLNTAIENRTLTVVSVNSESELTLYNELMRDGRLGAGECSAIAYAINANCSLVIDDVRASKQAIKQDTKLEILQTQDIIVKLIIERVINVEEADSIKSEWQTKYRFAFKFKSFLEIISWPLVKL
jgi:hypothetical protein